MPSRLACIALLASCIAAPAVAEITVESKLEGLAIIRATDLPAATADQGEARYCEHLTRSFPLTAAAKAVVAKGWLVTGEQKLGDLTAVSFVASASPSTSGTCDFVDGNIGLFDGDDLVGLVYSPESGSQLIGVIQPMGDGLRILSGDPLPVTVADLQRIGDRISITAPAAEEPVCDDAATVPFIEGLPIDEARKSLMRAGWTPVHGDPAQQGLSHAKTIADAGVPEVEDCAGTGLAFCAYRYDGPAGTLSVTTAGDGGEGSLPLVAFYGVDCR